MADSGIFERRNRTESRLVAAGAVVLCSLGWAASLFPVAAAVVAASVFLVLGLVALRRHLAVRARIEREVGERFASGWGRWGEDEPDGHVRAPVVGVVEQEQEAA